MVSGRADGPPAAAGVPGGDVGEAARGGAGGKREQRRGGRGAVRGQGGRAHRPVPSRRDAEDAVYGRDGYDYDGYRLRVEFPRSGRGTGRGGGGGGGGGAPRGRYGPPSRRSEYRVIVSGEFFLSLSRPKRSPGVFQATFPAKGDVAPCCFLKSIVSCSLGGMLSVGCE